MKKSAFKFILVLGLCLALVFSTVTVAQAQTTGPQMYAYSVFTSAGNDGAQTRQNWFLAYATGVWEPGRTVTNVQFEVWTTSKSAVSVFNGTQSGSDWRALFDISQFNSFKGTYHINAYGIDALGMRGYLGGTTIYVIPDSLSTSSSGSSVSSATSSAAISLYTSPASGGTFKVYATGLPYSAGSIAGVNFKVYCVNDESDVYWYSAKYLGNGKWTATANIANHLSHHGLYKIAAFTVSSIGQQYYFGTATVNVP